jgi:hypothetical protein
MRTTNLRWPSTTRPYALAASLTEGATAAGVVIDPPLPPRDEVIFLLHVAAEVEHALLVQYLYAAFSLRLQGDFGPGVPPNAAQLTNGWFQDILQTAEEEMGHLLTVQNILAYIGGPITFEREDFPFRADVYPFHFRLQPLQRRSLAKYVAAERPDPVEGLQPEETKDLDDLLAFLEHTENINRVGRVYDRLIQTAGKLTPDDVRSDRTGFQQSWQDWGTDDPATFMTRNPETNNISGVGSGIIVYPINNSKDMIDALTAIAIQGEGGATSAATNQDSHFWRFFRIYRSFPGDLTGGAAWNPVLPVAVNPNTTDAPVDPALLYPEEKADEIELAKGRITNPQTRLWAQLFNNRYRILLSCLIHALNIDLSSGKQAVDQHTLLIEWAFEEMRNLRKLSALLNGLNRTGDARDGMAGATFELPYALTFSRDDKDRWRTQRDILVASSLLYARIKPTADQAPILQGLKNKDGADDTVGRRKIIADILNPGVPPASAPTPAPVPVPAPPAAGNVSFAKDILPLFRAIDIQHMRPRGVPLDDPTFMRVSANAQKVLAVLTDQSMPPGGPAWSPEQLALFQKWIDEGLQP